MLIQVKKTKENEDLFNRLYFIAIAIAGEHESVFQLNLIKATKEEIMSSDGYRLHVTDNTYGWEPGYYQLIKKTKTLLHFLKVSDNAEWPNVEPLRKLLEGRHTTIALEKQSKHNDEINGFIDFAKIIRVLPPAGCFNPHYVSDARSVTYKAMVPTKNDAPICFKGDKCEAFVMPIRIANAA